MLVQKYVSIKPHQNDESNILWHLLLLLEVEILH